LGFALLKKDTGEETADGVSVTDRLRAWWNGDELDEAPPSVSKGRKKSVASGNEEFDDEASDTPDSSESPTENPWSETRRQLAQEIWSPGFVVPGGTDYIEKLVSGCSLTSAETMLEVGVGMGGGTRTIIGKFGNYVTGYERDANLAAAAMRHAVTYEIDDKLEVTALPFEEIKLKSKYFRAALMRDILYTIEDKAEIIGKIGDSLKTGESFLVMTDFLFEDDPESDALAAWKAVEERPVYPMSKEGLVKAIEGAGVQIRIIDDESDDYCAMVVDAWSDYMKTINGSEVTPEMGKELEREGEFWARRVAALKSGALRYYRIEAIKVS
jgi:SAM-dependent methyltransferase